MPQRPAYMLDEGDILLISQMTTAFEESLKALLRRRSSRIQHDDMASFQEIDFWRMASIFTALGHGQDDGSSFESGNGDNAQR